MKLRQRPHKSPLGVKFKFSDEHSLPFHMGASPVEEWRSGGVEEWRSGGVEEWRSGGVEEWRSGGVEEWRSGGVEEWRSGGVEEWRSGGVMVTVLFIAPYSRKGGIGLNTTKV